MFSYFIENLAYSYHGTPSTHQRSIQMAVINLGNTVRGGTVSSVSTTLLPGIGLKNTSSSNLVLGITHGVTIAPGAVRFFTTNDFDDRVRFNPRNHNVDTVSTDGKKPYLDDVNELAKLIANGTILVYTATQTLSSNTFTLGTTAAYTLSGDGSVNFS
jgi:hypothetical protein